MLLFFEKRCPKVFLPIKLTVLISFASVKLPVIPVHLKKMN